MAFSKHSLLDRVSLTSLLFWMATGLMLGLMISCLFINGPNARARSFAHPASLTRDPFIVGMIPQMSETEILLTSYSLQNFTTRANGYSGNVEAGTYLFDRLSSIPGLEVEYQGGSLRNVIATLPCANATGGGIYIAGAHYDSASSDPTNAPGATDNGGGAAIVLELARIMSQYRFKNTLKFAFWNAEESGGLGSANYAKFAADNALNISLYLNFDSACYDPDNHLILDIMYDSRSAWISDIMTQYNTLYGINFGLTHNVHTCGSDHRSFWQYGFTALMAHAETHGPAHTQYDTIDKVSTAYAMKNGQLGMSVIAALAGVCGRAVFNTDVNKDGKVDIRDVAIVSAAYGSMYNATDGMYWHQPSCVICPHIPQADVTHDDKIDIVDVTVTARDYGSHQ